MTRPSRSEKRKRGGESPAKSTPPPAGRRKIPPGDGRTTLTEEELRRLIEQAAYRRAQARGFAPGHELDDWLAAEREVREGPVAPPERERPLEATDASAALRHGVVLEVPPVDATAR